MIDEQLGSYREMKFHRFLTKEKKHKRTIKSRSNNLDKTVIFLRMILKKLSFFISSNKLYKKTIVFFLQK